MGLVQTSVEVTLSVALSDTIYLERSLAATALLAVWSEVSVHGEALQELAFQVVCHTAGGRK